MRLGTLILTVVCVSLLSGCASMNPLPHKSEQLQQEAIARWQSCLNRHSDWPNSSDVIEAARELQFRCEGHRRDVLLSYPAAVEPQLDALLRKQAIKSALNTLSKHPKVTSGSPTQMPSATAIKSLR